MQVQGSFWRYMGVSYSIPMLVANDFGWIVCLSTPVLVKLVLRREAVLLHELQERNWAVETDPKHMSTVSAPWVVIRVGIGTTRQGSTCTTNYQLTLDWELSIELSKVSLTMQRCSACALHFWLEMLTLSKGRRSLTLRCCSNLRAVRNGRQIQSSWTSNVQRWKAPMISCDSMCVMNTLTSQACWGIQVNNQVKLFGEKHIDQTRVVFSFRMPCSASWERTVPAGFPMPNHVANQGKNGNNGNMVKGCSWKPSDRCTVTWVFHCVSRWSLCLQPGSCPWF